MPKAFGWRARLGFDVVGRPSLRLKARTHNGQIKVSGLKGDVELATHNGSIDLQAASSIVRVKTHNGHIVAGLDSDGTVSGSFATHNGGIQVILGDAVSSVVACETHNGAINIDPALQATQATKRRAEVRVGAGEGRLKLDTHNGSISIKKSTEQE